MLGTARGKSSKASEKSLGNASTHNAASSKGGSRGGGATIDGTGTATAATVKAAPKGHVCRVCDRSDTDENPCPNRHSANTTLQFANSTECLPCRGFTNSVLLKKMDRKTMHGHLKCGTNGVATFQGDFRETVRQARAIPQW